MNSVMQDLNMNFGNSSLEMLDLKREMQQRMLDMKRGMQQRMLEIENEMQQKSLEMQKEPQPIECDDICA